MGAPGAEVGSPRASSRSPLVPVLLSALVWPGAGQLKNGHMAKGVFLILATGLGLGSLLYQVLGDVLASLPVDGPPPDLVQLAALAQGLVEKTIRSPVNLALLGLWTFAVADAYWCARNSRGR